MATPPEVMRVPLASMVTLPAVALTDTVPKSSELVVVMDKNLATVTLTVATADAANPVCGNKNASSNPKLMLFFMLRIVMYAKTRVVKSLPDASRRFIQVNVQLSKDFKNLEYHQGG